MKTSALLLILILPISIFSQGFTVDFSVEPDTMIYDFFQNDSVTVSNVEVITGGYDIAFFDKGDSDFPIGAGIILSTGLAEEVPNPASEFVTASLNLGGDVDIDSVTGIPSNDAVTIEFDFVPSENQLLDFKYIFGSEEYPEFVNSSFNDAFLFLISGPGINGTYSNNAINTATIPGEDVDVTINNVNDGSFSEYYIDNMNSTYIVYDGITTLLPANFMVEQGVTYHAKIVIADVGDFAYDSGIFLGYNSLGNVDSLVPPTVFSLQVENGNLFIENDSKYATEYQWDFGNGFTSSEKHPDPVVYSEIGTYIVQLTTTNYCCTNTYTETIEITNTSLSANAQILQNVSCFGGSDGQVTFDIQGGEAPYNIEIEPSIADLMNIPAGSYGYTITSANNESVDGTFMITEPEELVASETLEDSVEGENNGSISLNITGGVNPYDILWSTNETTESIENLPAGIYTVEVTDANNCSWTGSFEVKSVVSVKNEAFIDFGLTPNPSVHSINLIDIPTNISKAHFININGQKEEITSQLINSSQLNISHLKPGFYLIELSDSKGNNYRARFIKI
jgi:PKD repeat protein